jgi:phage-related protein
MKLPKIPSLAALWKREPVLVGTLVPLLATVGVLTTDQASALANGIAGVVAAVVEIAAAFGVRSRVSPVKASVAKVDVNVTAPLPVLPPAAK